MFKEIATDLRTMQPRRTKDSIGNRIYKGDYENRAFIEGGGKSLPRLGKKETPFRISP